MEKENTKKLEDLMNSAFMKELFEIYKKTLEVSQLS
jgi:hypothetical protein